MYIRQGDKNLKMQMIAVVSMLLLLSVNEAKGTKSKEICPEVCEPEKCPNVGPIGLSQCPAEQYIVTYRCGCCKRCDIAPITTTLSPSLREERCKKMTCPKKKVCVLNLQGIPFCKCPTDELCKRFINRGVGKKQKVCGTDGLTYQSRCHLKVASCASDGKIRVAKKGECGGTKSPEKLTTSTPPAAISVASGRKSKDSNRRQHPHNHKRGNGRKFSRRGDKIDRKQRRMNRKQRDKSYQRIPKFSRQ